MKRFFLITFLVFTQHINAADCLKNICRKTTDCASHPATPACVGFIGGTALGRSGDCCQATGLAAVAAAGTYGAHKAQACFSPGKTQTCLGKTKECLGGCSVGLLASQLPTENTLSKSGPFAQQMHDKCCIRFGIGACLTRLAYWKITRKK